MFLAFLLALLAIAQSQTNNAPDVNGKLDSLTERLTTVEGIVEHRTADVQRLRDLEEKFFAVEDQEIKGLNHRLTGVEGKLESSSPQLDHLVIQVEKLSEEIRDIRSNGAVSETNGTSHDPTSSSRKHSKDEERKIELLDKDRITEAIINSTDALNEMMSNLKESVRETLGNSLYELSSSKDELGNELSLLEHTVREALSNFTDSIRNLAVHFNGYFQADLKTEGNKLNAILRTAFSRTKKALTFRFGSLKNAMKSEFGNLNKEINKAKDAPKEAFFNNFNLTPDIGNSKSCK